VINHHLTSLAVALQDVDAQAPRLQSWGSKAASVLAGGGRLLACGLGGSAAQAQHLVARLDQPDDDRPSLAAFALPVVRAPRGGGGLGDAALIDQVRALGRPGDILLCVCAAGDGDDLVAAATTAADLGLTTWALTGPEPNPVAAACSEAVTVPAAAVSTAEEVHLAAIHIFCAAVDSAVRDRLPAEAAARPNPEAAARPNSEADDQPEPARPACLRPQPAQ
jgi:D-sedoheptulose 7-phosphate isomerase